MVLIKIPATRQEFQIEKASSMEHLRCILEADEDTIIWMSPTGGNPWTALSTDSWAKKVVEKPSLDTVYMRTAIPGDWESGSEAEITQQPEIQGKGTGFGGQGHQGRGDKGGAGASRADGEETQGAKGVKGGKGRQGGKAGKGRGRRGRGGKQVVHGGDDSPVVASTRRSTRLSHPSTKVIDNEGIAQDFADGKTVQRAIQARKLESKRLVGEFPFD
jgi:hypothetical protein